MNNLKPCPFCGKEAEPIYELPVQRRAYIICSDHNCWGCMQVEWGTMDDKDKFIKRLIDNWNRRPVAKKTKVENLKHLLDLVSLNPDLPVLPIVDTDCVVSDDYGYWLASIGSVEVTKILDDINYCKDGRFYREDDFDEIVEDLVSESDDPLDEEEAEDIVKNYPWRKVILVYIIPG